MRSEGGESGNSPRGPSATESHIRSALSMMDKVTHHVYGLAGRPMHEPTGESLSIVNALQASADFEQISPLCNTNTLPESVPRTWNAMTARNAHTLAVLAALVYEKDFITAHHLEREEWGFVDYAFVTAPTLNCFVAHNRDSIVVSFRGTEPFEFDDWKVNFDIKPVGFDHEITNGVGTEEMGRVHRGYLKKVSGVFGEIMGIITRFRNLHGRRGSCSDAGEEPTQEKSIYMTGHSQGSGLASVFSSMYWAVAHEQDKEQGTHYSENAFLYTFGGGNHGDAKFCEFMNRAYPHRIFKVINGDDVFTRGPVKNGYTGGMGILVHVKDDHHEIHNSHEGLWDNDVEYIHPKATLFGHPEPFANRVPLPESIRKKVWKNPAMLWSGTAGIREGLLKTLLPEHVIAHFPFEYIKRLRWTAFGVGSKATKSSSSSQDDEALSSSEDSYDGYTTGDEEDEVRDKSSIVGSRKYSLLESRNTCTKENKSKWSVTSIM
eukprot:Nk52_evm28s158 gene=Nk52_evmTU28s158